MRTRLVVGLSMLIAVLIGTLVLTSFNSPLIAVLAVIIGFVMTAGTILSIQGRTSAIIGGIATFILIFLLSMPITCAGGEGDPTTCSNLLRVPLPGFSGSGQAFSPSYWGPGIAAALAGTLVFYFARRRHAH